MYEDAQLKGCTQSYVEINPNWERKRDRSPCQGQWWQSWRRWALHWTRRRPKHETGPIASLWLRPYAPIWTKTTSKVNSRGFKFQWHICFTTEQSLTMLKQVSQRQGSPLRLTSAKGNLALMSIWARTLTRLYAGATYSPHWVQLLPSAKRRIASDELAHPGPTKWRVTNGRDIILGFTIPWCVLCYCCYSCAPAAQVEQLLFQSFISAPRNPNLPLCPSVISPAYCIPLVRK